MSANRAAGHVSPVGRLLTISSSRASCSPSGAQRRAMARCPQTASATRGTQVGAGALGSAARYAGQPQLLRRADIKHCRPASPLAAIHFRLAWQTSHGRSVSAKAGASRGAGSACGPFRGRWRTGGSRPPEAPASATASWKPAAEPLVIDDSASASPRGQVATWPESRSMHWTGPPPPSREVVGDAFACVDHQVCRPSSAPGRAQQLQQRRGRNHLRGC